MVPSVVLAMAQGAAQFVANRGAAASGWTLKKIGNGVTQRSVSRRDYPKHAIPGADGAHSHRKCRDTFTASRRGTSRRRTPPCFMTPL